MSIIRKALAACAIAAIVGSGALTAEAASASYSECDSGVNCIWDYDSYVGYLGSRPAGGVIHAITGEKQNKMASWANRTTSNAAWYDNADGSGGTGACHNMTAGTNNSAVGFFDRDDMEAWKTNGYCAD